ncbi:MAG: SDR family NAD(P)-dependent oxidoreductase [Deltaproteobacteria bacterium]|nr:SDR family NAD(P)-dependent oxidoreductase [Deltaproteobacteria bacterium]
MNSRFYLVTGGAGFIGAPLVKRLTRDGHKVRVLDNQSRGSAARLGDLEKEIEFVSADIRDRDAVQKAAMGVESVIHLAFINGTEFFYSRPDLVLDVGVRGMINVLDACIAQGVGELALASSSEVYQTPPAIPTPETAPLSIPDPHNPRYSYAGGKIISELMAINFGRKRFDRVLIFRPHNVYGPDMGWEHVIPQLTVRMKRLAEAADGPIRLPIQGTGEETRAFIFIDDFVEGVRVLLDKGEHLQIYHVGTMDQVSIAQVASLLGEYFRREVRLEPGEPAKGGTARRCPDTSKIAALGFHPKVGFREGLFITARWYEEHAHEAPSGLNIS